jgi:hypothetical protein
MARFLYIVLCLAGMAAFYAAYYWMTHAYGRDFGMGFGLGTLVMAGIASFYITLRYGE